MEFQNPLHVLILMKKHVALIFLVPFSYSIHIIFKERLTIEKKSNEKSIVEIFVAKNNEWKDLFNDPCCGTFFCCCACLLWLIHGHSFSREKEEIILKFKSWIFLYLLKFSRITLTRWWKLFIFSVSCQCLFV